MNETTLFLAQIMGPTIAIIGLGILLNKEFYAKVFKTIGTVDFDTFLTPMIMIPLGVILVMKHFLWGSFAEGLITVVGLGMLVKGAFLAIFPTAYKSYVDVIFKKKGLIPFAGALWMIGGAYLTWVGFFT